MLPGDLILAKHDGVIFIPAVLAVQAIEKAEFTNLQDAFNFELNKQGTNGAEVRRRVERDEVRRFREVDQCQPR
ncbi:MAG: hypothetical protein WDO73_23550 [Ignavibacteriota bacterium]